MMKMPWDFIGTYETRKSIFQNEEFNFCLPMGNVCAHRRRAGTIGIRILAGANGFVNAFGRDCIRAKTLDDKKYVSALCAAVREKLCDV
jgi:hypothetical protein